MCTYLFKTINTEHDVRIYDIIISSLLIHPVEESRHMHGHIIHFIAYLPSLSWRGVYFLQCRAQQTNQYTQHIVYTCIQYVYVCMRVHVNVCSCV